MAALDIVVDDDLAADFVVVQSFGHFRHAHDAGCRGRASPGFPSCAVVTPPLPFSMRLSDTIRPLTSTFAAPVTMGWGLVDRFARRGHVFDHDHAVAVVEVAPNRLPASAPWSLASLRLQQ